MGETEIHQLLNQVAPRSSVILRNLYLPTARGTTEIDLLLLSRKGIFVFEIKITEAISMETNGIMSGLRFCVMAKRFLSIILYGKMKGISGHYYVCFRN